MSRFNSWVQVALLCFGVLTLAAAALTLIATKRLDSLQKSEDRARQEKLQASESLTRQLQEELSGTKQSAQEAVRQLEEQEREKALAEERRRTAPILRAGFGVVPGSKQYVVQAESDNFIPFEYKWWLVTENDVVVSGVLLEWAKFFPTNDNPRVSQPASIQMDKVKNGYVELRLDYRSLVAGELNLPGHSGRLVYKYRISADGGTVTAIP